ncbi:porin family protein [Psychrobacter sp. NZS113]|jgi:opacity protein-like surface antigen|uniref:porin family protein n=1 Tax=Psychrobacter sp. NZS113 TaxID=2792045 RepID=UPI0018CCE88A|nr:porin family protein [Psychrobacter sp. NZS113]MBH0094806.1 porin family protein [Psychrobacter sp. NZS113]
MKTLQKTLMAVVAGSLLSVGAQAAVSYGNGYTGQPYVGAKVGQFDLDTNNADDPTAYGVYAGYNFDPNFGIEAEYVGSDDADYRGGDIDAKSYGAYGTYRYAFADTGVYAKGKVGVARTEVEARNTDLGGLYNGEDKDTSLAGGVGLGYSVTPNFNVEAEYDMLGSDTDLMTVGANIKF